MKTKIFILLTALSFSTAVFAQDAKTVDEGVIINGVKWATRNVAAPGTFADKPEDPGMLYQWNRKVGWSATGPMVNSNGGTDWDITAPEGENGTWEKANDPCPAGWRIPTPEELQELIDSGSEQKIIDSGSKGKRKKETGVNGRIFGSGSNTIFLPATNSRKYDSWVKRFILHDKKGNGVLIADDGFGSYWSNSRYYEKAFYLYFNSDRAGMGSNNRVIDMLSCRCVAEKD